MNRSRAENLSWSSWPGSWCGRVWSSPSLHSDEGYSYSPPSSLMCMQSSHPHQKFFRPTCSNMWLEGFFSLHPYCGSSSSALDVVSNTFLIVTINIVMVTMVDGILALICNGWHLVILLPFHFFFPSLESSWCSFCLELLGYPFLWPMFSR